MSLNAKAELIRYTPTRIGIQQQFLRKDWIDGMLIGKLRSLMRESSPIDTSGIWFIKCFVKFSKAYIYTILLVGIESKVVNIVVYQISK